MATKTKSIARIVVLAGCCVSLAACSSGRKQVGTLGGVYPRQQLGQFLKDTTPAPSSEYIIGVGDKLDIAFFFNEDLSKHELLVRSDGRITLPYVGDIMAAGQTPMRLDTLLTTRFGEILKDPNLSVIVVESTTPTVYVMGQVRSAGGYDYTRSISLLQALALAGGFRDGAKANHVLVIRRKGLSGIVGVEVDAKAIMEGESVQLDIPLQDLDIVYVPKTRIQSIADFAQTLDQIVTPPTELFLRGWQVQVLRQQIELIQNNNQ
ncbi:MAG: polysaccharide biosynthesis/export family protein [Candidatus Krumholzibacteriia bacterium]